jgi:REP-associated tyrosine transposase
LAEIKSENFFYLPMARIARVVAPDIPHHVTQRGNRRQRTFFNDEDYQAYLALMSEWCMKFQVETWAYCLMPNHVHLIVLPKEKDSLRLAIGEAHRRYTRRINFREGWRGHLWQGRFSSFILAQNYLLACTRYVELNPVRAGLVQRPEDWRWSSAGPHIKRKDDVLVKTKPLLGIIQSPWDKFLKIDAQEKDISLFKRHERTGRPLGKESFVEELEVRLGCRLKPKKPGPKGKDK